MNNYENMPTCYAITDTKTGEFYPDPVYTDKYKAMDKVIYLAEYRTKHKMKPRTMTIEELTKERYEQHEMEWNKWVRMID